MIGIIPPEDFLYKRIPPIHWHFQEDRVSSGAFKTSRLVLSVDWDQYSTPQKTLEGYQGNGLIKIQAKFPRQKELAVLHRPIKDDPVEKDNPAHSHIEGANLNKESTAKYLLENSILLEKVNKSL
ncbi:MAG: hypothetical protein ABIJ41_06470 [Candidatus Omnitrophota bacterium]